ncbi:sulfur transferase domain-containing protein [Dyella marensis]|jgi:uncharacterized protein (TIGR01244 family)|uniref:TIGR01244 family protein n=1 Tax=Dyella marensis TaxID=500610 RepID=A0A1I2CGT1_9GAMM|nr:MULTISPECIES: sulfur transferase domain-containing protein [Dyella]SFE67448.1 TIGR01244 family protein [Dyella marensis]
MPKLRWTFIAAIVLGAAAVLATAAFDRHGDAKAHVDAKALVPGVWISEQIGPEQLAALKSQGFRAVVDLRPDHEAAGQPSASTMGEAAAGQGLQFDYIPVAHGDVPSGAVETLGRTLAREQTPVLLYCRSGRRAARTWALAEASRPGGLDAPAILNAVHQAGQDAGDLADQITGRIAARPATH